MKKYKNFIDDKADLISKEGIVIFDRINSMLVYNKSYTSSYYVICINHSGTVSIEYNKRILELKTHQLSIFYPSHTFTPRQSSDDYSFTLIVVSKKMFGSISNSIIHRNRFNYLMYPEFQLTDSQYEDIMSFVDTLHRIEHIKTDNYHDMMMVLFNILVYVIDTFRRRNKSGEYNSTRANTFNLSPQFYEAVNKYFRQQHEVAFYANIFCLNPKYFSTIIKNETGFSASHWIHTHIVNEAKRLLSMEPNVSIQSISTQIGFSDQASFSRFFKRETGITPKDYRKKITIMKNQIPVLNT